MSIIDPEMTETMKDAAPMSSPIANDPESDFIAPKVEKTSGDPFPNARNVTPAVLSLRPSREAIVLRLGQKKSLATTPTQLNRKSIQSRIMMRRVKRSAEMPGFQRGALDGGSEGLPFSTSLLSTPAQ